MNRFIDVEKFLVVVFHYFNLDDIIIKKSKIKIDYKNLNCLFKKDRKVKN